MTAVDTAAANISAGMDKVVIAGGAEAMTQSPVTFRKPAHAYGGHGAVAVAQSPRQPRSART